MSDPNQIPATKATRNILPTCTGYTVTKFEPSIKYHGSEEEINNESGALSNIVGTDISADVAVELVVDSATAAIQPLSTLIFIGITSFPELAQFATGTAGQITLAVRGEVKPMGKIGGAKRIGLTCFVNTLLPTQT